MLSLVIDSSYYISLAICLGLLALAATGYLKKLLTFRSITVIGFMTILFSKLVFIQYNYEINPDESLFLATAEALAATDYLFWKDLDSGTSGIMNLMPIYVMIKLGFSANWRTLHFTAILIMALSWLVFAEILHHVKVFKENATPLKLAIITALSLTVLDNTDQLYNFYNSEIFPVLLLLVSVLLFVRNKVIVASIILYLIPFAKLMASPLCAFLYVCFFIYSKDNRKSFLIKSVGTFMLCIAFTIAVFAYYGILGSFKFYYLERNFAYSTDTSWWLNMIIYYKNQLLASKGFFSAGNISNANQLAHLRDSVSYHLYFTVIVLTSAIYLAVHTTKNNRRGNSLTYQLLIAGFFVVQFCIFKSGRGFMHYFYFQVYFLFTVIALTFATMKTTGAGLKLVLFGSFILIFCMVNFQQLFQTDGFKPSYELNYHDSESLSNLLNKDYEMRHGDKLKKNVTMKIWGWGGAIHLKTGIRQATSNNNFDVETDPVPSILSKTHEITMEQMNDRMPLYFVNMVDEVTYPQISVEQVFPELDAFLNDHYEPLPNDQGFTIYVLTQ